MIWCFISPFASALFSCRTTSAQTATKVPIWAAGEFTAGVSMFLLALLIYMYSYTAITYLFLQATKQISDSTKRQMHFSDILLQGKYNELRVKWCANKNCIFLCTRLDFSTLNTCGLCFKAFDEQ